MVHHLTKKRLRRLETISTKAGGVAGGVAGGLLRSVVSTEEVLQFSWLAVTRCSHCCCCCLRRMYDDWRPVADWALPVEEAVEQELPADSDELCDMGE